jgi:hypothetical protein
MLAFPKAASEVVVVDLVVASVAGSPVVEALADVEALLAVEVSLAVVGGATLAIRTSTLRMLALMAAMPVQVLLARMALLLRVMSASMVRKLASEEAEAECLEVEADMVLRPPLLKRIRPSKSSCATCRGARHTMILSSSLRLRGRSSSRKSYSMEHAARAWVSCSSLRCPRRRQRLPSSPATFMVVARSVCSESCDGLTCANENIQMCASTTAGTRSRLEQPRADRWLLCKPRHDLGDILDLPLVMPQKGCVNNIMQ